MSEHLPECEESAKYPDPAEYGCLCSALRACEQRVREEWYEAQSEAWEQGFHHALDAAREAVAALEPLLDRSKHEGGYDCCGCATVGYLWTDALAAIDALRGER